MYTQNKIVENIYFMYLKTGLKVISVKRYSVTAITLHYILRYRMTLYHSIATLSL
jgi:hypothetical protein